MPGQACIQFMKPIDALVELSLGIGVGGVLVGVDGVVFRIGFVNGGYGDGGGCA